MSTVKHLLVCIMACLCTTSCSHYAGSFKSNNLPGQINASFSNFNTSDAVATKLAAGELLFVSYGVQVTQGSLQLSVSHNKQILWSKKIIAANDTNNLQFTVKQGGDYTITIRGKHAAGAVLMNYRTAAPKTIAVATNANLELFGLMMQLDIGPDIAHATDSMMIDGRKATFRDWYLLADMNYRRYKAFDSSAMMQLWRQYRVANRYDDFFITFLEQVDEVPFAKINEQTETDKLMGFTSKGDLADAKQNATAFLDELNRFYTQIRFDEYLRENKSYYDSIKATITRNLPAASFVPVMENFYNKQFTAYYLLPVMNVPTSQGYGSMNNKAQTIYNAFGPFSFQSFDKAKPDLGFDYADRIRGLSVHEFGHSFVNPAINALPAALLQTTEYLYQPIKEAMSKKSYTDWHSCLNEHFVRAGEIVIARRLGDSAAANKIMQDNLAAQFNYLPFIVQQLEWFEKDLNPAKSYNAFVETTLTRLRDTFRK